MSDPAADTVERVFRQESGRAVATLVRLFGDIDIAEEAVQDAFVVAAQSLARRGHPAQPGRLDRDHRPQPRDRPLPPRVVALRPLRPGRDRRAHRRGDRGRPLERRPAASHLHLLPPGARPERPGGAHPAPARRAPDARDRAGVPGARADDGAAPRPREAQDPRGQHPVPHPRRRRAVGPPAARARGGLPDLQRGPHGEQRRRAHARRPQRRGDPPRAPARRSDARRGRGQGAARPAAAGRVAPPGAHRGGRLARAARRSGSRALGPRADRRGPRARARLPPAQPARPVPDPGRDQRGARRCEHGRVDRLGTDRRALRPAPAVRADARGRAEPRRGRRRGRRSGGRAGRDRAARPGDVPPLPRDPRRPPRPARPRIPRRWRPRTRPSA